MNPWTPLGTDPTPEEFVRLLASDAQLTLWALVEHRAHHSPGRRMYVDETGRSVTFGGFAEAVESAAGGLAELGIGPATVVTWQLPTSIDAFVLMGALSRLGAVQSPVLPILREKELRFICEQVGTDVLVVPPTWRSFDHAGMAEGLAGALDLRVLLVRQDLVDASALPAAGTGAPRPVPAGGSWVYFTSGTTADPKGVRHTERSAMATALHLLCGIRSRSTDVELLASPMTHVNGILTLTTQLLTGFAVVLSRTFDPYGTPSLAADHGVSVLRAPVPVVQAVLDRQSESPGIARLPHLRACQASGSARTLQMHRDAQRLLGVSGVLSGYGMTECPGITASDPDDTDEHLATTCGRPVVGAQVRVVDPAGAPCSAGLVGEVVVRGPQLFAGYVDASLDAECFTADGFYRSGDLGVLDAEGYLRITGRIKDVIIRNGENISAREVEDVLSTHPAVRDVVVVGVPDSRTGERCCAVIQLADGAARPSLADVAAFCTANLMAVQKVPEQLEFVATIPRNAAGKPEKARLRAQLNSA